MITKELQQLSDKLTGGHTSAHEISKQVDYIEKNYSGGGSGGGDPLKVVITPNQDWSEFTADKTFEEIFEACSAGKCMFIFASDPSHGFYQNMVLDSFRPENVTCSFTTYTKNGPTMTLTVNRLVIEIISDGDIYGDYYTGSMTLTEE